MGDIMEIFDVFEVAIDDVFFGQGHQTHLDRLLVVEVGQLNDRNPINLP
jgi:hypothetical protein